MSDTSNGFDPLKEAVEKIRREAYASGWKDALEAVAASITSLPAPEGGDGVSITGLGASANRSNSDNSSAPTVGTTPWYVMQVVQRRQGMTGAEVVAAVRADGHDVAEAQIRTALSRLEKRRLLANRHRKWFST